MLIDCVSPRGKSSTYFSARCTGGPSEVTSDQQMVVFSRRGGWLFSLGAGMLIDCVSPIRPPCGIYPASFTRTFERPRGWRSINEGSRRSVQPEERSLSSWKVTRPPPEQENHPHHPFGFGASDAR